MCCRLMTVQDSEFGKDKCAGANRTKPAWPIKTSRQPGSQGFRTDERGRQLTARNQERVDIAKYVPVERYGFKPYPGVTHDEPARFRSQSYPIGRAPVAEARISESL